MLIVFMFFNQFVFSQDFKVLKTEKIQIKRNEQFFFPKLSPDGSKILYTKQNYTGLYLYDLKKKTVFQISGKQGAGYKPIFSKNGTEVFYRENDYEGMRKISAIYSFNLKNKEKKIIESKIYPEQAYRSCVGILSFARKASNERLIKAVKGQVITECIITKPLKILLKEIQLNI